MTHGFDRRSEWPARQYAAGILPVTWLGDVAMFLVGRDLRDDSFSDFGGRVERADDNSPVSTAVREWYEETLGCVLTTRAMRARLSPHASLCLRSRTQNGHPYYMYVAQVPFSPHLRSAFHKALAFLRHRNLHKLYVEKTDVRWVTLDTLLHDLPKRSVFAGTLHKHRDTLERVAGSRAAWKETCESLADWHPTAGADPAAGEPAASEPTDGAAADGPQNSRGCQDA